MGLMPGGFAFQESFEKAKKWVQELQRQGKWHKTIVFFFPFFLAMFVISLLYVIHFHLHTLSSLADVHTPLL